MEATLLFTFSLLVFNAGVPATSIELEDGPTDVEIYRAIVTSLRELQSLIPNFNAHMCYDDVGCFFANKTLKHLLGILPLAPEKVQTRFNLYTDSDEPELLNYTDIESVRNSKYRPNLPTKVIVHGFGSNGNVNWAHGIKDGLLKLMDVNVIIVDWNKGSLLPYYLTATVNTQLIGRQIALLIEKMIQLGAHAKNVHLIGHSLGAHCCGFAGKFLKERLNLKPGRISGLDPAGPLFCYDVNISPLSHLDSTDADFVDVIHSNGGIIVAGDLGCYDPLGDVDFYPNGGRTQPGCAHIIVDAVKDIFIDEPNKICKGNHGRAYEFYMDSLSSEQTLCQFASFPCSSYDDFENGKCFSCEDQQCNRMGYFADPSKGKGSLYLRTMDRTPLCGNQFGVEVTLEEVKSFFRGSLSVKLSDGINQTEDFTLDSNPLTSSTAIFTRVVMGHLSSKITSRDEIKAVISYSQSLTFPSIILGMKELIIKEIVATDENGRRAYYCGPAAITTEKQLEMTLSFNNC